MKLSKSPPIIFLSNTANLKTIELIADQWAAKNWSPISPKKIFYEFFIVRRLNSVFKTKKKFIKKSKKIFLGQIGFQVFAAHWLEFNQTNFGLARFDRKINGGYFDSFIEKIRWEEYLYFHEKRRKTSKLGRSGTARILPMPAPMG